MASTEPPDRRGAPRRPRTSGDSTRLPVLLALGLFGLLLALLVLWWAWPLLTGA